MDFISSVGDCSGRVRISDASVIRLPAFPAIAQQRKLCCAIASRRHLEGEIKRDHGYKSADVPRMSVPGANRKKPYGGTLLLASIHGGTSYTNFLPQDLQVHEPLFGTNTTPTVISI